MGNDFGCLLTLDAQRGMADKAVPRGLFDRCADGAVVFSLLFYLLYSSGWQPIRIMVTSLYVCYCNTRKWHRIWRESTLSCRTWSLCALGSSCQTALTIISCSFSTTFYPASPSQLTFSNSIQPNPCQSDFSRESRRFVIKCVGVGVCEL